MSWWRTVWLVARREVMARRRVFVRSTAIILGVVIIGLFVLDLSGVADGAEIPEEDADRVLATLGAITLFGTIIGYGQMALLGVAEEKSSRVVEVVLGCVQPGQLLAGKLLGIGAFALGQVGLALATIAVMLTSLDTLPLPAATWPTLITVFVYFVLGYAFYSTMYAAIGALTARSQNASNAAGPLNLIVGIGYGTAVVSAGGGDNTFARIISLVPPFTPTVMPMRIARGFAAGWEIVLSVGLLLAGIYWVSRLAARVYIGGVMRGGVKIGVRDAFRAAEW
jgi:ABC-2 type transport system permease protein